MLGIIPENRLLRKKTLNKFSVTLPLFNTVSLCHSEIAEEM